MVYSAFLICWLPFVERLRLRSSCESTQSVDYCDMCLSTLGTVQPHPRLTLKYRNPREFCEQSVQTRTEVTVPPQTTKRLPEPNPSRHRRSQTPAVSSDRCWTNSVGTTAHTAVTRNIEFSRGKTDRRTDSGQ